MSDQSKVEARWELQARAWRDPHAVVGWAEPAPAIDPAVLRVKERGRFWEELARLDLTLIVTREYENLLLGVAAPAGQPRLTYYPLPHPSGLAFDARQSTLHVAATRNPNQLVTFSPLKGLRERRDLPGSLPEGRPLMPVRTRFVPGCLYMHDLAMVDGALHANAVGENAIVRFDETNGAPTRVWWPRAIERDGRPDFSQNYLQLNSIAAGSDLRSSYFSASAERIGRWRPGHLRFPVDGRGVIFASATREPVVHGLTRPHSARLTGDQLWVANSGYGELGVAIDSVFEPQLKLPGWTRGLWLGADTAVVGTSRVIPRFRHYAPGLDVDRSECGIHLVDLTRTTVIGSLIWPTGNQLFAIEAVPSAITHGFAQSSGRSSGSRASRLYYSFEA